MSSQVIEDHIDCIDDEDVNAMADMYMTFKITEETYGIAIEYILEIIELQKITEVPNMPEYVKGVINLRGKIIPVVDLRLRFNIEESGYSDRTCIIVTEINNTAIGFIIDSVDEVCNILKENISPAPDFKNELSTDKYIKGIGRVDNDVKIILDVEKLLYVNDIQKLNKSITDIGTK